MEFPWRIFFVFWRHCDDAETWFVYFYCIYFKFNLMLCGFTSFWKFWRKLNSLAKDMTVQKVFLSIKKNQKSWTFRIQFGLLRVFESFHGNWLLCFRDHPYITSAHTYLVFLYLFIPAQIQYWTSVRLAIF